LKFYRERRPETKVVGRGHFATFGAAKILEHTDVFDAIAWEKESTRLGEESLKPRRRDERYAVHDRTGSCSSY
jgi:hypothetical protein